MRLLVEVREDRPVRNQFGTVTKEEVVHIADVNAEGSAGLLADLLRSLADDIAPAIAEWELRGEQS